MGKSLEARLLGPESVEEIQALWVEAGLPFHPEGRDAPETLRAELAQGKNFVLGILEEGRLVAVALGSDEGRKGWVNRLAVKPTHRGRGLARRLIAECERAFAGRGIGLVCALVEDRNSPSLALFQDEGYILRKDILYLRKSLRGEDW